MDLHDFYYDLPQELIAQDPLADRSSSRLMVLDRETGRTEHKIFKDIIDYLNPGDCLVINDTKVIPARLIGEKVDTGAAIEVLLLKRKEDMVNTWEVLVKPGKKAKIGAKISFGGGKLIGEVIDIVEEGDRLIQFTFDGIFEEILDELGQMPLPPYITHKLEDKNRYQTVYAVHEGSAAAPTAGLHFTKELLAQIEAKGIKIARVTLHVGLGTFRPVKVENILEHHMHSEYYEVTQEAADIINNTKASGGRVIAVGTTSTRTLESVADTHGCIKACRGWTDIFIYPGYEFKAIDCLITNFHLPESTLVMLVSALAGREHVLAAYEEAVKEGVKFEWKTTVEAFLKGKNGRLGSCVLNTPEGERVEKFDRIYLAIGSRPANRIVSTTAGIEVDEKGYVKVVERPYGMTTRRGVFAGGDVVHRPQTVVLAMKAAKEVAQGIAQYVDAIKLLEEAKRIEQQGTVE